MSNQCEISNINLGAELICAHCQHAEFYDIDNARYGFIPTCNLNTAIQSVIYFLR